MRVYNFRDTSSSKKNLLNFKKVICINTKLIFIQHTPEILIRKNIYCISMQGYETKWIHQKMKKSCKRKKKKSSGCKRFRKSSLANFWETNTHPLLTSLSAYKNVLSNYLHYLQHIRSFSCTFSGPHYLKQPEKE